MCHTGTLIRHDRKNSSFKQKTDDSQVIEERNRTSFSFSLITPSKPLFRLDSFTRPTSIIQRNERGLVVGKVDFTWVNTNRFKKWRFYILTTVVVKSLISPFIFCVWDVSLKVKYSFLIFKCLFIVSFFLYFRYFIMFILHLPLFFFSNLGGLASLVGVCLTYLFLLVGEGVLWMVVNEF